MNAMSPRPNTRVQRTRSSPSAPHSPLTRYPLGRIGTWLALGSEVRWLRILAVAALILSGACASAAHPGLPRPADPILKWQSPDGSWRQDTTGVVRPTLKTRVSPDWPVILRQHENTGTVDLEVLIAADGTVRDAVVVHSVTQPMDEEAIRAVKQWTYNPATFEGAPVAIWYSVHVTFNLT